MHDHEADKYTEKMQIAKQKMRDLQKLKSKKHGLLIVITGNGKGKTTSGLGSVLRALGHGFKVGVIQFIKGKWKTGETKFMASLTEDQLFYYAMETGFTWDTQDRAADIAAAQRTWEYAQRALQDESIRVVLIDELTYMLNYGYLDKQMVFDAIQSRPRDQTVVVTGRDACDELISMADTVSEVLEIKHAFQQNIRAQKGVDY